MDGTLEVDEDTSDSPVAERTPFSLFTAISSMLLFFQCMSTLLSLPFVTTPKPTSLPWFLARIMNWVQYHFDQIPLLDVRFKYVLLYAGVPLGSAFCFAWLFYQSYLVSAFSLLVIVFIIGNGSFMFMISYLVFVQSSRAILAAAILVPIVLSVGLMVLLCCCCFRWARSAPEAKREDDREDAGEKPFDRQAISEFVDRFLGALHPPDKASPDEAGGWVPVALQAVEKFERMENKGRILQSFQEEIRQARQEASSPDMDVRSFERAVRQRLGQVPDSEEQRAQFKVNESTSESAVANTDWLWVEYIVLYQTFLMQNHHSFQEIWETDVCKLNKELVFRPDYGGMFSLSDEKTLKKLHNPIAHGIFVAVNIVLILLINNTFLHFGIPLIIRLILSLPLAVASALGVYWIIAACFPPLAPHAARLTKVLAFLLAKALLLLCELLAIPLLTMSMRMLLSAESACPEADSYPRLIRVSDRFYDFIFLHSYECLPCNTIYSSDTCRDMCQKNVAFSMLDPALRKTRDLTHTSVLGYTNALLFVIVMNCFPLGVVYVAVEALETVPICGAGKEDKWTNLMLSLSSPWLAAFSGFRYGNKKWNLVTGFYQVLFSVLVALAEVRPITFTVLILVWNLLYCYWIWREQPFNSQFNSVLEIVLSAQNAAFAIIAIVGATDASKTDKVADMVFYAFLGISAVLTAVLLIYDRVRVKHREPMGIPQRETRSHGGARRLLDNTDQSQQRDVGCCTATCTSCKCKCGICKRCGCCPDKEDDTITVSPADWRSIAM
jgi:hypothetical protein